MSEKVKQFMIELSKDPVKMEEFWKNPEAFLATADLTAEEKEILSSGDSARIQELLGAPMGASMISSNHPGRKPPHKP